MQIILHLCPSNAPHGLRGDPFVSDPWTVWEYGTQVQMCLVGGLSPDLLALPAKQMVDLQPLGRNLASVLTDMSEWVNRQRQMTNDTQPLAIYGVHLKSVACRIFGRFAQVRWGNLPPHPFGPSATWHDLFDLVTYPAIVTKEERYAFSPCHIEMLTNTPTASTLASLWTLTNRFQP